MLNPLFCLNWLFDQRKRRALLACVILLSPLADLESAPKWWQSEASPFKVVSNARKAEIQRSFEIIWNARAGLQFVFPQLSDKQEEELLLIITGNAKTRDEFSFRSGRRRRTLGGYFSNDCEGYYSVINDIGSEQQTRETLVHEYVHHLMRQYQSAPLWIKEGFAEFFSTVQQEADDSLTIGKPINLNVLYLRQEGFLPLDKLVAVNYQSREYRGGEHAGTFYSQSWLLIHYLILGEHDIPKPRVYAFIEKALRSNQTPESLFVENLGIDFSDLENRLKAYLNKGRTYTLKFTPENHQAVPKLQLHPVTDKEIQTLKSRVLLDVQASERSISTIETNLKRWPESSNLLSLKGQWQFQNNRRNEAEQTLSLALALDDQNSRAQLWHSINQVSRRLEGKAYRTGTLNKEETLQHLTQLFRAKQAGAIYLPQLYYWIGAVWLSSEVYPEPKHMEILEIASERFPGNYGITQVLAIYYARCGNFEKAEDLVLRAIPHLPTPIQIKLREDLHSMRSIKPIYN
ncbi:hypothetical protein [Pelagicoccus mobilis]|uniref:DUF1570 domain-containing protein n=1 Tax=Pelagicoccus mobilis TaxID=415221 RepID=A0A934RWN9_9BACT|nr:hypothetical protein [Pelagicoccus mobilis]MBK1877886.1 hypothetical protein [Pelagicoccus mobilis]